MRWAGRLLAAAMAVLPVSGAAAQDGEPIRIGAVYITSGPFSTYGEFATHGIELAVEEINAAGGLLGRPVTYTVEDSEGKANVAIKAIRRLVLSEKSDVLLGLDSSGVARGVAPLMRQFKKPFIITHAATPDVTGKACNEWVFRDSVNITQNLRAAADIAKDLGGERWTTIGPNYAFGHQSWEFFEKYITEIKPDVTLLEPNFPKFGAEDFKPFISTVMDQDPDGVIVSLWGGDLVNFVRQAADTGFFDQDFEVLLTLGGAVEVLQALGETMPEGVWVGTRYWYDGPTHQRNTDFVAAYRDKFGAPPSYNSQNAYTAVYAYKQAIEAAGSTDAKAVAEALEGMEMTAPIGRFTFREADHQAVVDAFWGQTAGLGPDGLRQLDPLKIIPGDSVIPAPAETGCTM